MGVILTQTDTTVGFLSQEAGELYEIKLRPTTKPFIKVYKDLKTFCTEGIRVPKRRKRLIRRAKKTTFVVGDFSFRVAKAPLDSQLLRTPAWFYSTSANRSGAHFERDFCEAKAAIIIEDKYGLREQNPSRVLKINAKKTKRLR